MRKFILAAGLLCICMAATAQTAREEIAKNPDLAAGKYYAYQAPETELHKAPDGYEPFYISAFARHGSRYLTKKKKYDEPISVLSAADKAGKLTADGRKALDIALLLAAEAEGRYGELTPKGAQQHRELVRRMYHNFKPVFRNGIDIDARSTYKTRAFLSMAAACVELKGLNPKMHISTEASQHDEYYIKYKNETFEAQHLANMDSVYHKADSVYIHPERLMKQLFNDEAYIRDNVKDPRKLMSDLFELDGISQSSCDAPDLSFLFTPEERYDMWQRNNFEWYYEKGASPLSGGRMFTLERNLLDNFITTADSIIASGKNAATLRYGHDTNLAPLAVLMGMDSLQHSTADWQQIAQTFRTYRIIPMCGNIQLVFYRKKGSGDILVKPLLNEREVSLPVESPYKSFYRWSDLRRYWKGVTASISLPEEAN